MHTDNEADEVKQLVLVYGSPTPLGRTASLLQYIHHKVNENEHSTRAELVIPSQDETSSLYFWDDTTLNKVKNAHAIIIASPVYRASMPAILKQLFDELPVQALRSKPVGLITVGNIAEHYLGVERHFYDILAWFGALYVPATCYVTAPSLNEGISTAIKEELDELVTSTLFLSKAINGTRLGPMPIAERYGR